MKDVVYFNRLFDIYGELLTDKQKDNFRDYYFNNLSLSEISDNNGTSRNATHKSIKDIEKKLKMLESKLNVLNKNEKILSILKDTEYYNKISALL